MFLLHNLDKPQGVDLEPNHTHFLFIEGADGKEGVELEVRSQLEKAISTKQKIWETEEEGKRH